MWKVNDYMSQPGAFFQFLLAGRWQPEKCVEEGDQSLLCRHSGSSWWWRTSRSMRLVWRVKHTILFKATPVLWLISIDYDEGYHGCPSSTESSSRAREWNRNQSSWAKKLQHANRSLCNLDPTFRIHPIYRFRQVRKPFPPQTMGSFLFLKRELFV